MTEQSKAKWVVLFNGLITGIVVLGSAGLWLTSAAMDAPLSALGQAMMLSSSLGTVACFMDSVAAYWRAHYLLTRTGCYLLCLLLLLNVVYFGIGHLLAILIYAPFMLLLMPQLILSGLGHL